MSRFDRFKTEQIRKVLNRVTKWPSRTSQTLTYLSLYTWPLTFQLAIRWRPFDRNQIQNFRGRLNYFVWDVFVTCVQCTRAMQAVFKKLRTKLIENGTISGTINTLLYGLTYSTCWHFALCSYFSLPWLCNLQNIHAYYMFNHTIRCIYLIYSIKHPTST